MPGLAIVSHLPGRLRLRHPDLRRIDRLQPLLDEIALWPGVTGLEGKAAIGSVLVRYDPARLSPAELEARLSNALPAPTTKTAKGAARPAYSFSIPAPDRDANRWAKIGMVGTLGLSLAALAGSKRLHAVAGAAFLPLLAVHMLHHRRKLWK